MKKCAPLWCEAHFQVKCAKHTRFGPLFSVDISKKIEKSVCRRGAKHMSKSKVQKIDGYGNGALLDVQMSFAWQAQGIVHPVKS